MTSTIHVKKIEIIHGYERYEVTSLTDIELTPLRGGTVKLMPPGKAYNAPTRAKTFRLQATLSTNRLVVERYKLVTLY